MSKRQRTYAVTGSSSGIGLATCQALEDDGHRVIGISRTARDVPIDLSVPAQRARLAERVGDLCGGVLDGLIVSAGVSGGRSTPQQIIRLNYFGALEALVSLQPMLARGDRPRAVVVSSIALLRAADDGLCAACLAGDEEAAVEAAGTGFGRPAYEATKRALSNWVRASAPSAEWAGRGMLLNAVAPSVIDTPLAAFMLSTPETREATLARLPHPLGFGTAGDVASLICWLAGEENGYVNGQTIFVDGGHEALTGGSLPRHPG